MSGAKDKVSICDEGYVWVSEITGFIAFQNVGYSPTLIHFNLRVVNDRVVQP